VKLSALSKLFFYVVAVSGTAAATWWTIESMVVARTLNEGRTVADMAENVGRWASQYGGVHVRTEGGSARLPGSFLTRSLYTRTTDEAQLVQGARADSRQSEAELLQHLEAYYWKNPALVQRELADVLLATGSRAQYRLTARSVLNPNNEPNAFELEALTAMQQAATGQPGKQGNEYWKVQDGRLMYARAVMAQKSCLKCHESAAKAPEFLRVNKQFNGGGGFGYQEGKPAGVISVAIPLPDTSSLIKDGLPLKAWGALGVAVGALLIGLVLGWRRPSSTPA